MELGGSVRGRSLRQAAYVEAWLWQEYRNGDGMGHGFVAGGGGVEVIAGVEGGEELVGVGGIADHGVEIDCPVEMAGGANPLIDGLAVGFARWARMVIS